MMRKVAQSGAMSLMLTVVFQTGCITSNKLASHKEPLSCRSYMSNTHSTVLVTRCTTNKPGLHVKVIGVKVQAGDELEILSKERVANLARTNAIGLGIPFSTQFIQGVQSGNGALLRMAVIATFLATTQLKEWSTVPTYLVEAGDQVQLKQEQGFVAMINAPGHLTDSFTLTACIGDSDCSDQELTVTPDVANYRHRVHE